MVGLVALAVFLFGGVHGPVRAGLAVGASLLSALVLVREERSGRSRLVTHTVFAAAALWVASLSALLPVGESVRNTLQPGFFEVVSQAAAVLDVDALPLALAPASARAALGFSAAVLAVGSAVASVARTRGRRVRLVAGVLGVAAGVAIVGLIHRAVGAEHILGMPGVPAGIGRERFFAPFVNPNHGGLVCALGLPLAVSLHGRRDPLQQAVVWIAAAACLAGVIASGSRGALLAGALGAGLAVSMAHSNRAFWASFTGVAALLCAVLLAGPGRIVGRITATLAPHTATPDPLGHRPHLWAAAIDTITAAPWLGVGPGSFGTAWRVLDTDPRFVDAVHAHQDALQAAAEHGIFLGTGWIALAVMPAIAGSHAALSVASGRRRRMLSGLFGALCVVLVASTFGFPFHIGAVALLYGILAGITLGGASRSLVGGGRVWLRRGAQSVLTVGALLVVTAPISPGPTLPSGPVSTEAPLWTEGWIRAADAAVAEKSVQDARDALSNARDSWPSNPYAWRATAELARRTQDPAGATEAWRQALSLNLPDNDDATPWLEAAVAGSAHPGIELSLVVPPRADRLVQAGVLAVRSGDAVMGGLLLEQAAALDPARGVPWARQLVIRRRYSDAITVIDAVPEDLQTHCTVLRARAEATTAGRLGDAERLWLTARRACPDAEERLLVVGLAEARALNGKLDGRTVLESWLMEHPRDHLRRRALLHALSASLHDRELRPHLEALAASGVADASDLAALERVSAGLPPAADYAPLTGPTTRGTP